MQQHLHSVFFLSCCNPAATIWRTMKYGLIVCEISSQAMTFQSVLNCSPGTLLHLNKALQDFFSPTAAERSVIMASALAAAPLTRDGCWFLSACLDLPVLFVYALSSISFAAPVMKVTLLFCSPPNVTSIWSRTAGAALYSAGIQLGGRAAELSCCPYLPPTGSCDRDRWL